MRLLNVPVICLSVIMALTSCDSSASVITNTEGSSTLNPAAPASSTLTTSTKNQFDSIQTNVSQTQAGAETQNKSTPAVTREPQVYFPEELLTAEEASAIVGQRVTLLPGSDEVPENGELWAEYSYDFPSGNSAFAVLSITQNALISEAELKKGHDAKWAFNEFKKFCGTEAEAILSQGHEAFYFEKNMNVHCLYGDYYIFAAFPMDADDAASLIVNMTIVEHVISKFALTQLY